MHIKCTAAVRFVQWSNNGALCIVSTSIILLHIIGSGSGNKLIEKHS